jgi:hypothetical protein
VKRVALAVFLTVFAGAGCIGTLSLDPKQVVETPTPVPDRFKADQPPALEPSPVDGCELAPSLDPNVYYCAKEEQWYRFAMNRWYMAFTWDGNWFPVGRSELPAALAKITPETKKETAKTREERLQELERKLEELDDPGKEPDAAPDAPPSDGEEQKP